MNKTAKSHTNSPPQKLKSLSVQKIEQPNQLDNTNLTRLKALIENPSTVGVLEFVTGVGATAIDKPADLLISGGRLTQALFRGSFYKQLYSEVHKYREKGAIPDENLESKYGKTIFEELMRTIDEENLDEVKFEALKDLFLHSVWKGTDEHSQMLTYQYFQVCKKLSSLDLIVLRAAFDIYEEPGSNQRHGGITEWEVEMSERLRIPQDLITQCRIENSGVSQSPKTVIFSNNIGENRHGLSLLGVTIGELLKKKEN